MNHTPITDWLERATPAPTRAGVTGFLVLSGLAAVYVVCFEFVPIIDHVNLAFHESGHVIFGLLGDTLGWLGGTLGQFVFPIATCVHFLRRGQLLSAAACALWGFENLRYTAFYLGDARSQLLPLVGGGQHDWHHLLGQWGLLAHDTRIAAFLTLISWSGWLLVGWIVLQRYRRGENLRRVQRREQERAALIARARASAKPSGPGSSRH
jgi:hypothetical protein